MAMLEWGWPIIAGLFALACFYGAQMRPAGHRGSTYACAWYGALVAVHTGLVAIAPHWVLFDVVVLAVATACVALMIYRFRDQRERLISFTSSQLEKAIKDLE